MGKWFGRRGFCRNGPKLLFTLSIGMGSLAIFGSYIGKERSLTGEAVSVTVLDTSVALIAGLIIFPACSAFISIRTAARI